MNNRNKQINPSTPANRSVADNLPARNTAAKPLQRKIAADTFKDLVTEQMGLSQKIEAEKELPAEERKLPKHTTVGFEFEFAAMGGKNPFKGASHVEVSESTQEINGLPFKLETDANNTLELVTPPLWIETTPELPIALPGEIRIVDALARSRLRTITGDLDELLPSAATIQPAEEQEQAAIITMGSMIADMASDPGLTFTLEDVNIDAKNLSAKTTEDYNRDNKKVKKEDVAGIEISKVTKFGNGINTQINMATNAETYAALEQLMLSLKPWDKSDRYESLYQYLSDSALPLLAPVKNNSNSSNTSTANEISPGLDAFSKILIRYFAGQPAVPYAVWLRQQLDFIYNAVDKTVRDSRRNSIRGLSRQEHGKKATPDSQPWAPDIDSAAVSGFFGAAAEVSSYVKDVTGVWLKDTLMNVGLGLLTKMDWRTVHDWMGRFLANNIAEKYVPPTEMFEKIEFGLDKEKTITKLKGAELKRMEEMNKAVKASLASAANQVMADIKAYRLGDNEAGNNFIGPLHTPEFMKHNPKWIGARQDTYIDGALVSLPAIWPGLRLHVVELRMSNITEALEMLISKQPKVAGKENLALPPFRLITTHDWFRETGFLTISCLNTFFNEYAVTKDDPMAGNYDLSKMIKFDTKAPGLFIKWLREQKCMVVDWAEQLNLPLDFFQYNRNIYLTGLKMPEVDFYKTRKAGFLHCLTEFKLNPGRRKGDIDKIWDNIFTCSTEKGIPAETITRTDISVWEGEKQVASAKAAALLNPWKAAK